MAEGKKRSSKRKPRFTKEVLSTSDRVTVSTGGGEPIPKGEKWTDEKRDEDQPRTDDGKFGTYASVGKSTKYEPHGWRGTYEKGHPLNPDNKKLTEKEKRKIWSEGIKEEGIGPVKETPDAVKPVKQHYAQKIANGGDGKIKKGTKFAINGAIFIAAIDMSVDDFVDKLRVYWQGGDGKGHFSDLDPALIRKSGARTKAEKEALERSQSYYKKDFYGDPADQAADRVEVVTTPHGNAEIASLRSERVKKQVKEAAKQYRAQKGKFPTSDQLKFVQKRSLDRTGDEAAKHYNPDSDHDDKYVMEQLNNDPTYVDKLLNGARFMDGEKWTVSDFGQKAGISNEKVVDMLKRGKIKLSDIKKALRGE